MLQPVSSGNEPRVIGIPLEARTDAEIMALIGFLGTVAFAYYIEKGELPWPKA